MPAPIEQSAELLGGQSAGKCKRCMNCKCNKAGAKKVKKKRAPSAYNKFVKSWLGKNKGKKLSDAASAWKASKK